MRFDWFLPYLRKSQPNRLDRSIGLLRRGAMLLAGNSQAQAVVRVVAVDDDGQIHFVILPGSVAKNRHLLDRTVA